MILGIDPSLSGGLGFVGLDGDEVVLAEAFVPGKKLGRAGQLFEIEEKVDKVLLSYPVELAVLEGYAFSQGQRAHTMGEVGWAIRRQLAIWNMRGWTDVAPTALKKFATGKGNAPKDVVIMNVFKRWGFETNNNNIADAYVLARIGQALKGKETWEMIVPQKQVIQEMGKAG